MTIKDKALDPLFIEVSDTEFVLKEVKVATKGKAKGEEYEVVHGYFTHLGHCLVKATKVLLSRGDTLTLAAYIEKYNSITNELTKI